MLSWLSKDILKILVPMIGVAVMGAIIWWLWSSNQNLNKQLGKLRSDLNVAISFNKTNDETINKLKAANADCTDKFTTANSENEIRLGLLQEEYDRLKEKKQRVRIERQEIYRDPSCEELGNLDITTVCPALSDSLRESARGIDGT